MNKELVKEVVREMIISGEIQLGIGKIDPLYGSRQGTLIFVITDTEDGKQKKPLKKQDPWDGLAITEILQGI